MRQSMSRRSNCLDNAPMESFFHTLKVELVQQRRWDTRDEARRDVFAYITTTGSASTPPWATGPPSRWRTLPPDPCPSKPEEDHPLPCPHSANGMSMVANAGSG